jgi:hypothetical protein
MRTIVFSIVVRRVVIASGSLSIANCQRDVNLKGRWGLEPEVFQCAGVCMGLNYSGGYSLAGR